MEEPQGIIISDKQYKEFLNFKRLIEEGPFVKVETQNVHIYHNHNHRLRDDVFSKIVRGVALDIHPNLDTSNRSILATENLVKQYVEIKFEDFETEVDSTYQNQSIDVIYLTDKELVAKLETINTEAEGRTKHIESLEKELEKYKNTLKNERDELERTQGLLNKAYWRLENVEEQNKLIEKQDLEIVRLLDEIESVKKNKPWYHNIFAVSLAAISFLTLLYFILH